MDSGKAQNCKERALKPILLYVSTYLLDLRHPSSFVMENCKLNWLRHMPNGLFVSFFRSISQMSTPIFYNITLQRYGVSSHKTIGKYIFLGDVTYDIKLLK